MEKKYLKHLIGFLLLVTLCSCHHNQDGLKLAVDSHVREFWSVELSDGGCQVSAQLDDEGQAKLLEITGQNVGQYLSVTFCGQNLVGSKIQTAIDSGVIGPGKWSSKEECDGVGKLLVSETSQSSCEQLRKYLSKKRNRS